MSVTRIDREIGPRGYDPYNSADRDAESALEWRWVSYQLPRAWFDDSFLWNGRDGRIRRLTARSETPIRILGVEYA